MWSSAHDSDATTQPSRNMPTHSGRTPSGSRKAINSLGVSATTE